MTNNNYKYKKRLIRFKNKDLIKITLKIALISFIILSINPVLSSAASSSLTIKNGDPSAGQPYSIELTTSITDPITVRYLVDGAGYSTENYRPYCIFGDDGTNCYKSRFSKDGLHTIKANVYPQGGSNLLATASIVVNQMAASSLTIKNGDPSAGQPYSIELTTSITDPITVKYLVDGASYSIENYNPYCIFGDDGTNCYKSRFSKDGLHTIKANVYPQGGSNLLATASVIVDQRPASTLAPTSTPSPSPTMTSTPATSPVVSGAFYVATNGNDVNPGTESQPWRTIQKAANTAVAGDTVYVKPGTYNEQVTVKNSGSDGKYITFASYTERAAIIDGTGLSINVDPNGFGDGLFQIFGKSYIKVIGFAVKNSPSVGIFVRESGTTYPKNIVLQKNYIYNTKSSGIIIRTGSGHIVDGNEIERAANGGSSFRSQEIISLQGIEGQSGSGITNFEVMNNKVHDGGNPSDGGEGIDAKVGASYGKIHHNTVYNVVSTGIYVDGWDKTSHHIDIYDNIVHDVNRRWGNGIEIGAESGGSLDTINIYNNLVYNNNYDGIRTPSSQSASTVVKNINIINNVVYNNGLGPDTMGGIAVQVWFTEPTIQNVRISNNIVFNNKGYQIAVGTSKVSGTTITNNLVYPASSFEMENDGLNVIRQDPKFVSITTPDFHLQSSSPAVDKGTSTAAPNVDFDANTRPMGADHDIGAYEYVS